MKIELNEPATVSIVTVCLTFLVAFAIFKGVEYHTEISKMALERGMERTTIQGSDAIVWAYPKQ